MECVTFTSRTAYVILMAKQPLNDCSSNFEYSRKSRTETITEYSNRTNNAQKLHICTLTIVNLQNDPKVGSLMVSNLTDSRYQGISSQNTHCLKIDLQVVSSFLCELISSCAPSPFLLSRVCFNSKPCLHIARKIFAIFTSGLC